MTRPLPAADRAAALHERRRVQCGVEAAALVLGAFARGDVDAVHRLTERMTHQGLRQLVATLGAAVPARTNVRAALSWLEES